ncbi:MAG: hypothetical protein ACM3TU_01755 [Bacillota bacterium]
MRYALTRVKDSPDEHFVAEIVSSPGTKDKLPEHLLHVRTEIYRTLTGISSHSHRVLRFEPEYEPAYLALAADWLKQAARDEAMRPWLEPRPFVGVVQVGKRIDGPFEHNSFGLYLPDFALYSGMVLERLHLAAGHANSIIARPDQQAMAAALRRLAERFSRMLATFPQGTPGVLPQG